jgi:hypothetical protein
VKLNSLVVKADLLLEADPPVDAHQEDVLLSAIATANGIRTTTRRSDRRKEYAKVTLSL